MTKNSFKPSPSKKSQGKPSSKADPGSATLKRRTLAIQVLTQVLGQTPTSFEYALDSAIAELPAESAWLTEVCSGVLRWKGRLDFTIDAVADRKKPSGRLRKALLVAAYQLIAQDKVPAAWVVSETVDWVKTREGAPSSHFANACLRKISDSAPRWRDWEFPASTGNSDQDLKAQAAWASLPPWLWKTLLDQRGEVWSRAFALASLERPKVWLRVKPGAVLSGASAGPIAHSLLLDPQGRISDVTGFEKGDFIVQDLSSQLAIEKVLEHLNEPNGTCLDLCAAPGGKAITLSWSGLKVLATDQNQERLKLLRDSVHRVRAPVEIFEYKAVKDLKEPFDLVWVDAPCSSSGLLRRHPDIRWTKGSGAQFELNKIQADLLQMGSGLVKSGGVLAYSVCSLFLQEGKELISSFLTEPESSGLKLVGEWEFAPHDGLFSPDGFYLALFKRV